MKSNILVVVIIAVVLFAVTFISFCRIKQSVTKTTEVTTEVEIKREMTVEVVTESKTESTIHISTEPIQQNLECSMDDIFSRL